MFEIEYGKNKITVWMHGVQYVLTNPADIAAFNGDRGWYATLSDLVGAYLNKLVRAVRRISAAICIVHEDVTRYLAGMAPLTYWQEQKLKWRSV